MNFLCFPPKFENPIRKCNFHVDILTNSGCISFQVKKNQQHSMNFTEQNMKFSFDDFFSGFQRHNINDRAFLKK